MKEKLKEKSALPQAEEDALLEKEETIPQNQSNDVLIPVKFNKETKNLKLEEASLLAQKGMKFDLIAEQYAVLKDLSKSIGKSVPQFLEDLKTEQYLKRKEELVLKCGGDEALASHIIDLENQKANVQIAGVEEFFDLFPEIKKIETLPQEVLSRCELNGTLLTDEYLRYLYLKTKQKVEAEKRQHNAEKLSIGSQLNHSGVINAEAVEFLKGLWKS
ncbi:MAG: hypothetical protein E7560_01855 [Ruminococcaceae bacterium]|nr:hypothetical protein [Oscillospiraceae bacterium]